MITSTSIWIRKETHDFSNGTRLINRLNLSEWNAKVQLRSSVRLKLQENCSGNDFKKMKSFLSYHPIRWLISHLKKYIQANWVKMNQNLKSCFIMPTSFIRNFIVNELLFPRKIRKVIKIFTNCITQLSLIKEYRIFFIGLQEYF